MLITLKDAINHIDNSVLLQFDGWTWKKQSKLYIKNECERPVDYSDFISRLRKVYNKEIKYSRENIIDAINHREVKYENDFNKHDGFIIRSLIYAEVSLSNILQKSPEIIRISYRGPLAEKFYDTYKYLSEMEFFYRIFFTELPMTYLSMRWKGPIMNEYDDDYPYPQKWVDKELNKEFEANYEDDFTKTEVEMKRYKIGSYGNKEVLKALLRTNPRFFENHPEIKEGVLYFSLEAEMKLSDGDKKFIENLKNGATDDEV